MPANDIHLLQQVSELEDCRARCLELRKALREIVAQDDAARELAGEQRAEWQRKRQSALMLAEERIRHEAAVRREQLDADLQMRRQAIIAEHDRQLADRAGQFNNDLQSCRKTLQNELWVLQSVCDETGEDTPVRESERQQERFETQKAFLEEQLGIVHERMSQARQYLKVCHTATDENEPPANREFKGRDSDREAALQEIDKALIAANALESLRLPFWIAGGRLWGIGIFLFVVVTILTTGARADLVRFVNPELRSPDWQWLGVSALIGFAVSLLTMLIVLLTVQSRLRELFDEVQQHTANARAGLTSWIQCSRQELKKMTAQAEAWQASLTARREKRSRELQEAADAEMLRLNREYAADVARRERAFNDRMAADELEFTRQRQAISAWETEALHREQQQIRTDAERREAEFEKAVAAACEDRQTLARRIRGEWTSLLSGATDLARRSRDAVTPLHRWPVPDGPHIRATAWQPPAGIPRWLSAGDLLVPLPDLPDMPPDSGPGSFTVPDATRCLELPALLRFPQDTSLLVEHDAAGREAAIAFVRAILLRLLTSIPPGRVQFTLIDPVGLGQSFSAMMHLADDDELLISNRIWTGATQIRERLQKVTEHMERIFQTYLRSDFDTIEDYNRAAGEVAEPYHFVVVADFPVSFTDEAARALTSILTSGPRCGVHAMITRSPDQPLPRSFDPETLTTCCLKFVTTGGRVVPDKCSLEFDALRPPVPAEYVRLVKAVGERSRHARRVEVSFQRISPPPDAVWTFSSAEGLDLPIGRAGAARLQHLRLGRGTSQHVLVAGKTGSGKSTLLHILITNLALHYSPQEVQFFLIDFKKGVEFRTYAANRLPHAKVIAIESDREFGLSVLERLDEILQERGELFRIRGVQDLPAFRRQFPQEPMPRLLLLIDEFQEFFTSEDRVASRASLLLDRLIRQGRAFGIHVLLGSQTLGGAYSLARSTLGQVAVRIALQCSEADAHLILSEDNAAARLLTRPGEAIYNDANGLVEGNHPFQIAWLDDQQREELITSLARRPDVRRKSGGGLIVFEGNAPPLIEHCAPLRAWLTAAPDATRRVVDARTVWVGEPVSIAPPLSIDFRRSSGQNLLMVGQDSGLADAILAAMVISWCGVPPAAGTAPARAELVHDGTERSIREQWTLAFSPGLVAGLTQNEPADVDAIIGRLAEELAARESGAVTESPDVLLLLRNIAQFRQLRRDDDDFGMGSFGTAKAVTPASQLGELIRRGPSAGIHVVIWSDTFSNAVRWLSTSLLREFDNRIAFRMNQADSASFIDTPAAAMLTTGRAILYRDQTGSADRFRPFRWPGTDCLQRIRSVAANSDVHGINIDELTIE